MTTTTHSHKAWTNEGGHVIGFCGMWPERPIEARVVRVEFGCVTALERHSGRRAPVRESQRFRQHSPQVTARRSDRARSGISS